MNNSALIMLTSAWGNKIPSEATFMLQGRLEKIPEDKIQVLSFIPLKDPIIGLILGLFFGALSVDRFYKGDIGLGILKFISLFIFFIGIFWALADLYFVWQGIKKDNLNKINQQLMILGV